MKRSDLEDRLSDLMKRHPVPGAGIGVWRDGRAELVFTGITSIENPLPVDRRTRFQIGSVSKTYAVTAVMRLVSEGRVRLDAPVRAYVPELRLRDEKVAREVTVRQLLNHTAGWDGSATSGGQPPAQPLSEFVDGMAWLEQLSPPGARPGYNNAAIALAGRLVEKITGQPYEQALRSLVLQPLGMASTGFTDDDLVTERCMVGHIADPDGDYAVARPWRWPRAAGPEGGVVSTLEDQLTWAAFHLGDGTAFDGSRVLGGAELTAMQSPTVELIGSSLGDAIGLGWFLRNIGGSVTVQHWGTTNGQHTALCLVPEHRFAVVVFTNGTRAGESFNRDALMGVLDDELGLRRPEPTPRAYDPAADGDVTGSFDSGISRLEFAVDGGEVTMRFSLLPATAAELGYENPEFEPCTIGFLPGERGEFVITDGPFEGLMGYFAQRGSTPVRELDFGGRWHQRVRQDE